MFSPSIQKAGQTPLPKGSLMRASIRPYCQLRSAVWVEAPGAAGLQACRRVIAVSVSDGADYEIALAVLKGVVRGIGVDFRLRHCPSRRLRDRSSTSPGSGAVPAVPLNSSLQTSCQPVVVCAGAAATISNNIHGAQTLLIPVPSCRSRLTVFNAEAAWVPNCFGAHREKWAYLTVGKPGTDSEFPANGAGNSCQSPVCGVRGGRLVIG